MNAALYKTIAAWVVGTTVLAAVAPAGADEGLESVWIVNTRRAPRSGSLRPAEDRITYWRLQADRRWQQLDAGVFHQEDEPSRPTTVFIHGNRTDRCDAVSAGWRVYRQMKRDASGKAFRLVIWSWPSDRIRGRTRQDLQVKACRSDVQAYYLADCLRRIRPDVPVGLVGYSFGARVITGTLHLLAGGHVAGRSLAQPAGEDANADGRQPRRRAVLLAAALDADWLLPGHRNGLALSQVQRMLVTRNHSDPVLKWYPLMYRRGGPPALGYAGPAGCPSGEDLDLLNLSCSVGRAHDFGRYMVSSSLRGRLAWYTFLLDDGSDGEQELPLQTATEPRQDPLPQAAEEPEQVTASPSAVGPVLSAPHGDRQLITHH
ncbi:MAG: hypothetical protein JXB62_02555 [Pirellulales bacterium]|nr:hypothetical protein [Pirellulales bacterium]